MRNTPQTGMNAVSQDEPGWATLVADSDDWSFRNGKLYHRNAPPPKSVERTHSGIGQWIVKNCYAVTKTNSHSREALQQTLRLLDAPGRWGLNLGAANTSLHSRLLNLDLFDAPNVHIISDGGKLPFADGSIDVVVSQEVLEHIQDPFSAIAEIARVLKPGGQFYCQVPFIIGYHPGPTDFWRFTREAFSFLFRAPEWEIQDLQTSLGHGSGFYRILVEFIATTISAAWGKLYQPAKGLAAVLFYPLQWFDVLTPLSPAQDRIPGGYYCVVRKK